MKYIRVFMFLMVLVALLIAGCTSAAVPPPAGEPAEAPAADVPSAPTEAAAPATDDSPWQVVLDIEVEQPMRMAAFLDENFGLTGGADNAGKAQYTTNGGEIWTMADTSGG
jgi:hypothetical protein